MTTKSIFGIILLFACGCSDISSIEHQRVLYVRDPAHHCELYFATPSKKEWDYTNEKPAEARPVRKVWSCDGGMLVGFDSNEEQP